MRNVTIATKAGQPATLYQFQISGAPQTREVDLGMREDEVGNERKGQEGRKGEKRREV